jgi:hypothetical protein
VEGGGNFQQSIINSQLATALTRPKYG